MGTFNTLIAVVDCVNCNKPFTQEIQFKYATVWQYLYNVGDKLTRTNNYYDIGKPGTKVKACGISADNICPNCDFINEEDFDLFIENDVIIGVNYAEDLSIYFDTEGDFVEYE
ncbi:hypothetical protein [Mucilaginibacter sp. FT3.2]|uniref:hypothetical protein n=1 Tax=Mucilaginibacter sp. FT3.2 TaxID=2723090 RepID=UPI00160A2BFF|nr:hypothetical protein [Mucilaginibacter sp. FT3.2]MBB6234664.1 hypothetical protein [Mucilaginibacter sp. FT3.2]